MLHVLITYQNFLLMNEFDELIWDYEIEDGQKNYPTLHP